MTTAQALLIFLTVAVAGVGPFVAVYRGGSDEEFGDEHIDDGEDMTPVPWVPVDPDDPYSY